MPADIPLHLVRDLPKHADHLFRGDLVRFELSRLNDGRGYGSLFMVDAGRFVVDRGSAADLASRHG